MNIFHIRYLHCNSHYDSELTKSSELKQWRTNRIQNGLVESRLKGRREGLKLITDPYLKGRSPRLSNDAFS